MTTFELNIIKPGVSEKLDSAVTKFNSCNESFLLIRSYLNDPLQTHEKSPDTDFVNIHKTEKSGSSLQITNKRSKILQQLLTNKTSRTTPEGKITLENGFQLNLCDVKFKGAGSSSTTMEIESPQLSQLSRELLHLKDGINTLISETYIKVLYDIENEWTSDLENIIMFISKADTLQCKTYLAKNFNYAKPIIDSSSENAYVSVTGLRHCLIEHLQQNEIYVANDISIGEDQKGILLFGTNAVGKTSLIRAMGVAIIMAQSGMYVPSSTFIFKPYTAIYSRILGNDNIFKGLSTFAVEMSELRIILKMSDQNSLILGDELCSGTETESALSIFVAGLMELSKNNSSFIFATHFHEILAFDEVSSLTNVSAKHMAVHFDRENDCLVYDRKLRDGSGPRIYGLEVCKSLHLETGFLDLAYSLRNKYFPDTRGSLSSPTSVYNAEKIRGICEMCNKKLGEETHHLSPQKDADVNGFIDTFHKNHVANLASICEKCHLKLHNSNEKEVLKKKKTTNGYKICKEIDS